MTPEAIITEMLALLKAAGPELLSAVKALVVDLEAGKDPSHAERLVEAEAAKRFLGI